MFDVAKFLIFVGLVVGQSLAETAIAEPSSTTTGAIQAQDAKDWKPLTAYPDKVKERSGGYQISGINIGLLQARVTELEKQVERLSVGKGRAE